MSTSKRQKSTHEITDSNKTTKNVAKPCQNSESETETAESENLGKDQRSEPNKVVVGSKKRKFEKALEQSDSDLDADGDVQDYDTLTSEDESEVDSDPGDDSFPMKKQKKEADNGHESFASAFNAIIGSKLKAYDRKDPILARNRTTQKKLESEKLEAKARRLIRTEKKEEQDRHRIKNLIPQDPSKIREALDFERGMKKVAQKGVVRLFNAVLATQVSASNELAADGGLARHPDLANEITKLTFLDLVKAAGQD